jgi:SAM-dependent methyltransferase
MHNPSDITLEQYLTAKRTVDDRALNRGVFAQLHAELARFERPRLLEIGAGTGTMVARLCEWSLFRSAEYTLLDVNAEGLATARAWLTGWAESTGRDITASADSLHIQGSEGDVQVRFVNAELGAYLAQSNRDAGVDLLIANAFLDLVDIPSFLPSLFALLAPTGLFWFTINFDGETIFLPEQELDREVMRLYHLGMDERVLHGRSGGDSKTGRKLFPYLRAAGAEVLAAGSSDWVVFARHGSYLNDEALFLHYIVQTVDEALSLRPELDQVAFANWIKTRHDEVERGELVYIAHQLDFLGRPGPHARSQA